VRAVALLRGINVSGTNKLPMKELVGLCKAIGCSNVGTCIQSGNVVFDCDIPIADIGNLLQTKLKQQYALAIPVCVFQAQAFVEDIAQAPFAAQQIDTPQWVVACFSSNQASQKTRLAVEQKASKNEQCQIVNGRLWVYFAQGIGRSKITPALLDAAHGAPTTMRNVKTLHKIAALV